MYIECICSELTISNEKWICFSIYRAPNFQNKDNFFNELSDSFSKANESYENMIFMGDFHRDIISNKDHDKLGQIYSLFNIKSLNKKATRFAKKLKSTIDLILTNKPLSFQSSSVTETGLSYPHKLTTTFVIYHISLELTQRLFTTEALTALMKVPF